MPSTLRPPASLQDLQLQDLQLEQAGLHLPGTPLPGCTHCNSLLAHSLLHQTENSLKAKLILLSVSITGPVMACDRAPPHEEGAQRILTPGTQQEEGTELEGSPLMAHLWLFPWGSRGQTSLGSRALPSFNQWVTVRRVKHTQGEGTQETRSSQDIKRLGCTKVSLLSIASSLKSCLYAHFTDYKTGAQIRNDLSNSRLRSKLWNYSFVVLYIFILSEKRNVHSLHIEHLESFYVILQHNGFVWFLKKKQKSGIHL